MRGKVCPSVRVLLCDAGEIISAVLNLGQGGSGSVSVQMYRQSRRVLSGGLWLDERQVVGMSDWGAG